MDVKKLTTDPLAFRQALVIDADAGPQRFTPDPWQSADFAALDAGWQRAAGMDVHVDRQRAWLERPRGHSKTADLACMVVWALLAARRRIDGVAAGADRDVAKLLRDAVARLVQLNPWLAKLFDVQQWRVVNRKTGSELVILSSDAPSSYGLTPCFVVCDELVHWGSRELWDSLLSAAAKRERCMVVVITNAGFSATWQWETREVIRTDPAWHFSRLDGPQASWLSPAKLAEQQRLLPAISYQRLWLNQWSSGSGDALESADIDAAFSLSQPPDGPEPGHIYIAGVDLGLKRDASAIAVLGRHVGHWEQVESARKPLSDRQRMLIEAGLADEPDDDDEEVFHAGSGRRRLAAVRLWRPAGGLKVDISEIERALIELHRRFKLAAVGVDPWQAAYLMERLNKLGVPTLSVDFTPANLRAMATEVCEAFSERQIDLFRHEQLEADLRALRVEEKQYGVRLTSPRGPGGHGDVATALSVALHVSKSVAHVYSPHAVSGPLVYS